MAKALLGHVGSGYDLRLAAEVRRLRGRVAALEAELDRLRDVSTVTDEDLRLLTLDEQLSDSEIVLT